MWSVTKTRIPGGERYRILDDDAPLCVREFLRLLATGESFAAWYTGLLAGCDAEAFFWELPPIANATLEHATEFVLIDAPLLAGVTAEPEPFARQLDPPPEDGVIAFPNLGGDALLVVPDRRGPSEAYAHLAAFVRGAPGVQIRMLWSMTASQVLRRIGDRPLWLSTSGLGVRWLHVRLDRRPKYFQHAAYRRPPVLSDG